MKISKYTISKVEEKAVRQGEKDKGYQERFQDEYENDDKKVKIMGFKGLRRVNTHLPPPLDVYATTTA